VSGPFAVALADIPSCFEGIIPCAIGTVGADGMPNITYLSLVHRIDDTHVALSRQFFKKTEENASVNPRALLNMVEPSTGRQFQLAVVFERAETEGPLFERLRLKLDAVAAHEGMEQVFQLRGVDICRVESCEMVPCDFPEGPERRDVSLEKVEAFSRAVADAEDMDDVLQAALAASQSLFGHGHTFIMLVDETGERLYTVASAGYAEAGTGSEVRLGEGVIGLAAQRRQTVRLTQMARDLSYSAASRESGREDGSVLDIPLPILPAIQSQMVTPMLAFHRLVGVLCFDSQLPGAFQAADECVAGILANQAAMALASIGAAQPKPVPTQVPTDPSAGHQVKHYREDDSVFIDNEYLIKGVAGGILWRLLKLHHEQNRSEFSNKEIRLDQSLDLPDIKDNLEARLILLRKRLEERCEFIRIEKTARGRFRLDVTQPIFLISADGGGPQ